MSTCFPCRCQSHGALWLCYGRGSAAQVFHQDPSIVFAWADVPVGLRSYGIMLWEILTGEDPHLRRLRAPKCATKPRTVVFYVGTVSPA